MFEFGGLDVVIWNEFWERLKSMLGKWWLSVYVLVGLMRVNVFVIEWLLGNILLMCDFLKMFEVGDNVVMNDDVV